MVFTGKWITSETTHRLVTLTNEVRVRQGKEGLVLNEWRKKERRKMMGFFRWDMLRERSFS